MDRLIVVGGVYKHFKGFKAHVLNVAKHTETGEILVVYECFGKGVNSDHADGIYARPIEMLRLTGRNIPMLSRNIGLN